MKNVNWLKYFSIAALLAASIEAAHATPIIYALNADTNRGTLTGTVTIDSLTKLVTAANITFNDARDGNPVFTNIGTPTASNGMGLDLISGTSNSSLNYGGEFALYYDVTNLGTGDLGICTHSMACGSEFNQASYVQVYSSRNNNSEQTFLSGGTLTSEPSILEDSVQTLDSPNSSVPEPSSLALLGTGIIALAVLMARLSKRSPVGAAKVAE